MIEIQDYIRKLHEQTGVKLKEDDPILIELVAQQIILEEFNQDLISTTDKIESVFLKNFLICNKNNTIQYKNLSNNINKYDKKILTEIYKIQLYNKLVLLIIFITILLLILVVYISNK